MDDTKTTQGQHQPSAQEVAAFESFADQLLEEYDAQMYDCVAQAANECPDLTKEDIKRFSPFINGMMVRLFALGVGAMGARLGKQAREKAAAEGPTVVLQ